MNGNKWLINRRWLLCGTLMLTVFLVACQSGSPKNTGEAAYDENLASALLAKGQTALQKDQLTSPENDNAYYYFRKVLLMAPDQPEARNGMEAIFDRYLDFARTAHNNGDFPRALAMVDQAEKILLPSKTSKAMRVQILEEQKRVAEAKKAKKPVVVKVKEAEIDGIEYLLSIEGLNSKDKKIRERLKLIAEHTQTLKGSVRIEGRDEDENHWIYEQLKAAVPQFTLHADIRKSQYPKVVVLRPN